MESMISNLFNKIKKLKTGRFSRVEAQKSTKYSLCNISKTVKGIFSSPSLMSVSLAAVSSMRLLMQLQVAQVKVGFIQSSDIWYGLKAALEDKMKQIKKWSQPFVHSWQIWYGWSQGFFYVWGFQGLQVLYKCLMNEWIIKIIKKSIAMSSILWCALRWSWLMLNAFLSQILKQYEICFTATSLC